MASPSSEVDRVVFKSKKRGLRQRKKSSDSEDDVVEDNLQSQLKYTKELQKLRQRANGIPLSALCGAKETTDDSKAVNDPFKLVNGGMVDMKTVVVGKELAEELSIGTTFSAETNRRDEDADMMKYIDEQLAKRKGESVEKEIQSKRAKSSEDALYEVPEHLRISSSKKSEEMLSNQMLSGIPEVDLGIEAKIRNIEATEDAKQKLVRERMNKKTAHLINIDDGTELPKPKKSKEVKCTPVVGGDGEAPYLVEIEDKKQTVNVRDDIEKATDDFHFEKFKKQFRRY
uniref:Telomere length and silencing protein 1 homolog n=1 Tax=Strigamia maritima TaxID=126957 RepID=T1IUF4_STRMM